MGLRRSMCIGCGEEALRLMKSQQDLRNCGCTDDHFARNDGTTNSRMCGLGQENPAIKNHFFQILDKNIAPSVASLDFFVSLWGDIMKNTNHTKRVEGKIVVICSGFRGDPQEGIQ